MMGRKHTYLLFPLFAYLLLPALSAYVCLQRPAAINRFVSHFLTR
jgi:hypothetical protein